MKNININPRTRSQLVYEALMEQKLYGNKKTEREKINEYNTEIEQIYENENSVINQYLSFSSGLKADLLAECFYKVGMPALRDIDSERKYMIFKGLVQDYIKENGAENLLHKYKTATPLLYEMYSITNRNYNSILETVDKKNPNTYNIDVECKDNFFQDIDASSDLNATADILKERMSSALDDFVIDNMKTKSDIEEILQQAQERVDATKDNAMAEAYSISANRKIKELKRKKARTVMEAMVHNVAKSTILNESMKDMYTIDNKLNMKKIVDETAVIYAFVEMLNLCKMENVNDEYILKTIDSLN